MSKRKRFTRGQGNKGVMYFAVGNVMHLEQSTAVEHAESPDDIAVCWVGGPKPGHYGKTDIVVPEYGIELDEDYPA